LKLAPAALGQFHFYLTQLKLWNQRVILTGLKTDRDLVVKHFLDSLAVLPFLGPVRSLADLGSGPGFPGLALKLVRPELQLTLVEAREKKAAFLEYIVSCRKLNDVTVARTHLTVAEAREWGPRFEAVVSRAAFKLRQCFELAAPILLPGGLALALKGPHLADGELEAAATAVELLGLTPPELKPYRLPLSGEPRLAVLAYRQSALN
ncbi:MAG: 16S rRNA (guanine(527)-N(7))-methyltransferase RsmG, partial [Deltaproteobacteria bacterium]|nr:16S rRNA (guanine(527)-N(7))-methyltransferase RsmG [Deltaproteobacteria bacterium]